LWRDSLLADERTLFDLPEMLASISEKKRARMSFLAQNVYSRHFSSVQRILLTTFSLLESRIFKEKAISSFLTTFSTQDNSLPHFLLDSTLKSHESRDDESLKMTALIIGETRNARALNKLVSRLLRSRLISHVLLLSSSNSSQEQKSFDSDSRVTRINSHQSRPDSVIKTHVQTQLVLLLNPEINFLDEEVSHQ
jgi:hypothetical protein